MVDSKRGGGAVRRGPSRRIAPARRRQGRDHVSPPPRRRPASRAGRPRAGAGKKGTPVPQERVTLAPMRGDGVRVVVLGGASEVGKNMYAIEYGGEIVVLECGILFGEQATPGVNAIMPNVEYLKERKKDIRAMVISDAAASHIGALPFALRSIGNPTIYARALTRSIIEKQPALQRDREFLNFQDIEEQRSVALSEGITLTFFGISDATPSTFGVLVETPGGCVAYTGSLRVEHKNGVVYEKEAEKYAFLKEKNILLAMGESVNAEKNGFALSEQEIVQNVANLIEEADGRVILPLFASQVQRNALILNRILKLGKKVYIHGRLLMRTLQEAAENGMAEVPQEYLVPVDEIDEDGGNGEAGKTVILVETEENETYTALSSASFDNHPFIRIQPDDTIAFPTPILPTRASALQNLQNRLSRMDAVISSYPTNDAKALGHAGKNELLWLLQQIRPRYFMPIQGHHYMMVAHSHIAKEAGVSMENCVIPENGLTVEISKDGKHMKKLRNKIPKRALAVDGKTPSVIHDIVLQERKTISQEGIFIVIVLVDGRKLTVTKSPDIISRGFIYLKESQDLMSKARLLIKEVAEKEVREAKRVEIDALKKAIQKSMKSLLMAETAKQPVIVPVIFT